MSEQNINRRDFSKITMAALGGMVAGTMVGCGGGDAPAPTTPATPAETVETASTEVHVCRGLNSCKGMGAKGENACAGQGACATAAAHECAGQNECKGQGGCGGKVGTNECKGQGGCHVPLQGDMWTDARAAFEEKMKEAGKEIGPAPEA